MHIISAVQTRATIARGERRWQHRGDCMHHTPGCQIHPYQAGAANIHLLHATAFCKAGTQHMFSVTALQAHGKWHVRMCCRTLCCPALQCCLSGKWHLSAHAYTFNISHAALMATSRIWVHLIEVTRT